MLFPSEDPPVIHPCDARGSRAVRPWNTGRRLLKSCSSSRVVGPVAKRGTYLALIEADRRAQTDHAAGDRRRKPRPPHPRADYPRRKAIQKDLARHYEDCKKGSARKRFVGPRLKQYCSGVAWKIVRRSDKYPDYPWPKAGQTKESQAMPRRNARTGKFMKRRARGASRRRSRGSEETRRRRRARAAGEASARSRRRRARRASEAKKHHQWGDVHGYRRKASVAPHRRRTHEPTRRRSRRGSSRRRRGGAVVVVTEPMYAPRRRRRMRHMREPVRATLGGTILLGTGVVVGVLAANMVHRYVMGVDPTSTSVTYPTPQTGVTALSDVGTYNDLAASANPSMASIGFQLGVSVFGFALGAFLPWAPVKALFLGIGLGALGHLAVQLVNAYVLEPLFSGTNAGKRMYSHEWKANGAFGSGTMGASNVHGHQHTLGPKGQQRVYGHMGQAAPSAAAALPAAQPQRTPVALATRVAGINASPLGGLAPQPQSPGYASQYVVPGQPQQAQPQGATPPVQTPPTPPPAPPQQQPPAPMNGGGGGANGQPPANGLTTYGCQPNCACANCANTAAAGGMGQPVKEDLFGHPGWALLLERQAA
jgi:hypothetical protein